MLRFEARYRRDSSWCRHGDWRERDKSQRWSKSTCQVWREHCIVELTCLLLDDPLSAVDAHVGSAIINEALLGDLKEQGRTTVLVTHATHFETPIKL